MFWPSYRLWIKPRCSNRGWVGMKNFFVGLLLVAAVTVFFALDLDQSFSLDGMKAVLESLHQWRLHSPLLTAAVFFLAYVLVAACAW